VSITIYAVTIVIIVLMIVIASIASAMAPSVQDRPLRAGATAVKGGDAGVLDVFHQPVHLAGLHTVDVQYLLNHFLVSRALSNLRVALGAGDMKLLP
jgi:hypothetical protein